MTIIARGSKVSGRLANYYEDRFLGFAFYAAGYIPPNLASSYKEFSAQVICISAPLLIPFTYLCSSSQSEALVGYDEWGYWDFLSQDDASQIIKANSDSLWTLQFSLDPRLIIPHFSPHGALQAWIQSGSLTETFLTKKVSHRP